jgi:hypothetical protein
MSDCYVLSPDRSADFAMAFLDSFTPSRNQAWDAADPNDSLVTNGIKQLDHPRVSKVQRPWLGSRHPTTISNPNGILNRTDQRLGVPRSQISGQVGAIGKIRGSEESIGSASTTPMFKN